MQEFEQLHIVAWTETVEQVSTDKLAMSLLRLTANEDSLRLIEVNFDPQLVNLLRETKYFIQLAIEVPEQAKDVYERASVFRRHIGSLDLIVGVWNRIQKTILAVEIPLVLEQLKVLDGRLEEGLSNLNWNSSTIDKYIEEVSVVGRERSGDWSSAAAAVCAAPLAVRLTPPHRSGQGDGRRSRHHPARAEAQRAGHHAGTWPVAGAKLHQRSLCKARELRRSAEAGVRVRRCCSCGRPTCSLSARPPRRTRSRS